ncbi:hypothetical protein [Bacillus sp. FJAT-26390]|uniref:hypothetical protein n=1 Tax=Bacillus sp. FJAT-26390 TaxID=1743142 RepID=UPI000807BC8D|nr:hypothetical protein [Bacillus sp. FJAT-26390]OBZ13348.1 hypothetical protein A7975_10865 [Bacillus sp. FJAT-26390]
MSTKRGQCGKCDHIADYSEEEVKSPAMVACKNEFCRSKSVWRVWTDDEIERMVRGEKVE